MKGQIIYIKGHKGSESQSKDAYESFLKHGWDVEMVEGITPDTLDEQEFDYPLIEGGRLHQMKKRNDPKYYLKKSCISNQIRMWRKCVKENVTMAFIEHDAICIGSIKQKVDELVCLNIEYAFYPPSVLAEYDFMKHYRPEYSILPQPLAKDYPLKYYKRNYYTGAFMIPGTAAYAISPKGAKKLLKAAEEIGIDQSDFFINSKTVKIEYITPSPVKFNEKNLNTSHGF